MKLKLPYHVFGCGAALLNQHKLILFGGKNDSNRKVQDSVIVIHLGTGEYNYLKNLNMPCYSIFPVVRESNMYHIYHYGDENESLPRHLTYISEISY
jgi:hypothetical protein